MGFTGNRYCDSMMRALEALSSCRSLTHNTFYTSANSAVLTGVTPDIFNEMTNRLRPSWERLLTRRNRSARPCAVGGLEDHLLVMLILYRCHITQDFLGLLYGVDKATICRALARIEKLCRGALGVKRRITVTKEEASALLIDATEQPVERPKRKQKCWYSGKKKRHSIKNEIITSEAGRIVSVSKSAPGTVADITIRRRASPLPKNARITLIAVIKSIRKTIPP